MEQVSRPYQIALAGLLAFVALWFVALRPKPVEDGEPAAAQPAAAQAAQPGGNAQTGGATASTPLGAAVENAREGAAAAGAQAQGRADASNAVDGASAAAANTGVPAGAVASVPTSAQSTASPAAAKKLQGDLSALPKPVGRAVASRKIVVLLFHNPRAADDRGVRRDVMSMRRFNGKVVVLAQPISRLSRFTAITRAVPILGTPTVLVIDRKRNARALGGYFDRETVEETVLDAYRASR